MQDSCNGRFVALSYGRNGDGDDQSGVKMQWLGFVPYAFMPSRPFRRFHFSFFILIQDLFAEMTGARTVPRAPLMHSIGLGFETGILFRRSHRQSKYTGIIVGLYSGYQIYETIILDGCQFAFLLVVLGISWQSIGTASVALQIFVRGQCVGGCDDLLALQQDGTLQKAAFLK